MIEARALSRSFTGRGTKVDAVSGVDLHVAEGEIVGFLGPNGAGKTTTLRMLTTLLAPTSGSATVAGYDLRREPIEVRRRIGYVAQGGCHRSRGARGRGTGRPGAPLRHLDLGRHGAGPTPCSSSSSCLTRGSGRRRPSRADSAGVSTSRWA